LPCIVAKTVIFGWRAGLPIIDGAYHRFTGKVTLEKFGKDVRVECFADQAIWELMYFGKARSSLGG
jgi:hypothetical protein